MHLKHLSEHYGHQVTSQILRFAVEQDVSVIVLPRYNQEYSRNVMKGSGNWGPLHLSTRIRQYLEYKAWKNGIIVIEVHATGISKICAKCGAEIIRTDTRTELCCCRQRTPDEPVSECCEKSTGKRMPDNKFGKRA